MRIVAGRTKAACGIVFIKYGVTLIGCAKVLLSPARTAQTDQAPPSAS